MQQIDKFGKHLKTRKRETRILKGLARNKKKLIISLTLITRNGLKNKR